MPTHIVLLQFDNICSIILIRNYIIDHKNVSKTEEEKDLINQNYTYSNIYRIIK